MPVNVRIKKSEKYAWIQKEYAFAVGFSIFCSSMQNKREKMQSDLCYLLFGQARTINLLMWACCIVGLIRTSITNWFISKMLWNVCES